MTIEGDDGMPLCLREQDLDWREIGDEIVVLDGRAAVYLAVQGSGAVLWRLLADSTTQDRLVEALVETYRIDSVRAADDVEEFLTALNAQGLLAS
jgi:hypothetical protein